MIPAAMLVVFAARGATWSAGQTYRYAGRRSR
jgi:hypothetical protein